MSEHPDVSSYYALRADLLRLADEENKSRLLLVELQRQKNEATLALVQAAEKLMNGALAESGPDAVRVRKVEVKPEVRAVVEHAKPGRACSLCKQRGHNRRSCPNAHEVRKQDKKRRRARRTR